MQFLIDLSELRRLNKKEFRESLDIRALGRTYKFFSNHYRTYWKILTFALSFLFLSIGIAVLAPWPLKLALDHLILDAPLPEEFAFLQPWFDAPPATVLVWLAISVLSIAILKAVFSYFNKFYVSATGKRIIADIRERVFGHLQRLSLSFHSSTRTGELIYTITADVQAMNFVLISFPQDFLHSFITFAAAGTIMFILDWRLALIAFATIPILAIMTRVFGSGLKAAARRARKKEGEITALLAENLRSMALVQAYGQEENEEKRFTDFVQKSLSARLDSLRLSKTYSRLSDLLNTIGLACLMYFGGHYALGSEILPGTLVIMTMYLRDVYGEVEKFNGYFIGLANAQISAERLHAVLENETIISDAPDAEPAPAFAGDVELKDVTFAYHNGPDVLKNLSFSVNHGETVALIGPSGAGKSTLISLLLRFHDPASGEVHFDGKDIRSYQLRSVRDQITILLQDAKLFNQSVFENIAFGKRNATREDVERAARLAEAHEFIAQMPDGYDTIISEGGENLSGGQRQRINIARAIIRDTPIVILDEPSAGLDAEAEMNVHRALRKLTVEKTTFIIAHKLSTIRAADKILLLKDGKLEAQGTHAELLRSSATYKDLWTLQETQIASENAA